MNNVSAFAEVNGTTPGGERILVFVPMYRCAPQIPRVIEQFARVPGLPADLAPGQWRLATADEVASIFTAPESLG